MEKLRAAGAAVLAVSIDSQDAARGLARDLGLTFPLLSDPEMQAIRRYGMKGSGMQMADMGYVVIDRQGRIQAKRTDPRFGDNVGLMLDAVIAAKRDA